MYVKPLTKIQQDWLDHINQAAEQKLSMSAYAKQNNLALKSFYNARSTFIKKYDGRRVVIPNSTLFNKPVIVNTAYPSIRQHYDIGIDYDADIETSKKVIQVELDKLKRTLDTPEPDVITVALGDSAVILRARWWTDSQRSETTTARDKVISTLKNALVANKVNLPFPTHVVVIKK